MLTEPIRTLLKSGLSGKRARNSIRLIESWKYLDRHVWNVDYGETVIYQALTSGQPQAIGKLGSVEWGLYANTTVGTIT